MNKSNLYDNEKGIAVILALIMLLVMSVLALTVSFSSNSDFKAMSNYKQGQESFLAAERCILEGRNRLEVIGITNLQFLSQFTTEGDLGSGLSDRLYVIDSLENGAFCRTGPRNWHDPNDINPAQLLDIPEVSKSLGRPFRNTDLNGGVRVYTVEFIVTGKDSRDQDIGDDKENINTGTEIAVGFETFIAGSGDPNMHSGR